MAGASNSVVNPCLLAFRFNILTTLVLLAAAQNNVTPYFMAPGAKVAQCGYYDLTFRMFATSTSNYVYVTDTECSASTASPCQPPTNPLLQPVSCSGVYSCERQTSQSSAIPLCVVVQNTNASGTLNLNLIVTGSQVPLNTAESSKGSGGLSTSDIVLISVGSFLGFLIVVAFVTLLVWLLCCRKPPGSQVAPYPAGGKGLEELPPPAPALGGGLPLHGSLVLVPRPPGPGYPYTAPYPYRSPYVSSVAVHPAAEMPYMAGPRSPNSLVPLPPAAYRAVSAAGPSAVPVRPAAPPLPPSPQQAALQAAQQQQLQQVQQAAPLSVAQPVMQLQQRQPLMQPPQPQLPGANPAAQLQPQPPLRPGG